MYLKERYYGFFKRDLYTDFVPDEEKFAGQTYYGNVIKRTDSRGILHEIQYIYENDMFAYIRGHLSEDGKTFHLAQIFNKSYVKRSFFGLMSLIEAAEVDLGSSGVVKISTKSIDRLVPVALTRYGYTRSKVSILEKLARQGYTIYNKFGKKDETWEPVISLEKRI